MLGNLGARKFFVALLPGLLTGWISQVYALSETELAKIGLNSTVLVVALDARGQPLSIGSGFYVEKDLVATNWHVIAGASSLVIQPVDGSEGFCKTNAVRNSNEKVDLVLVDATSCPGERLLLRPGKDVQLGEKVLVVSNPLGLKGSLSSGIVSGFRELQDVRLLQITAPISPGSSGGPVLDSDGRVIGMATAVIRGGQNLNLAIPSDYIAELLKAPPSPRIVRTFGKPKSLLEEALSGKGEETEEGVVVGELLWDSVTAISGLPSKFSITIRNRLERPIKNIRVLVVFYNAEGETLDYSLVIYEGTIPPGLARRVRGEVDSSVQELTTRSFQARLQKRPESKVEYRVLYYELAETSRTW